MPYGKFNIELLAYLFSASNILLKERNVFSFHFIPVVCDIFKYDTYLEKRPYVKLNVKPLIYHLLIGQDNFSRNAATTL